MIYEIGLKGASGLGDTIIAWPIVKYYAKRFDIVNYMTDYPELYETIPNVRCYPHKKLNYMIDAAGRKHPVDIRFTYCPRKYTPGSNQFEDSCISAKVSESIKLEIDWIIQNDNLVEDILAASLGKKICILAAPYEPFGRDDDFGKLLRIKPDIMQAIVDKYKDKVYFVQVGNNNVLHQIKGIMNIINKTTVSDLMDLVQVADFTLAQVGNMLPLSEALGTPSFTIFSSDGLKSENRFISSIKPEKVVTYPKINKSVIDGNITEAVEDFGKFIKI